LDYLCLADDFPEKVPEATADRRKVEIRILFGLQNLAKDGAEALSKEQAGGQTEENEACFFGESKVRGLSQCGGEKNHRRTNQRYMMVLKSVASRAQARGLDLYRSGIDNRAFGLSGAPARRYDTEQDKLPPGKRNEGTDRVTDEVIEREWMGKSTKAKGRPEDAANRGTDHNCRENGDLARRGDSETFGLIAGFGGAVPMQNPEEKDDTAKDRAEMLAYLVITDDSSEKGHVDLLAEQGYMTIRPGIGVGERVPNDVRCDPDQNGNDDEAMG
jgi:hypothetical protein